MTEEIKPWISFEEALKKSSQYGFERNLLIGNGFSIAYSRDIFNYSALFNSADFSEDVKAVFKEFDTWDFEKIINKFNQSARLLHSYKDNQELADELIKEAQVIKEALVKVISEKHPDSQRDIGESKLFNALMFLSNFGNIFTLNYDLLLYWVLMNKIDFQSKHGKKYPVFEMDDGFRKRDGVLRWAEPDTQNVFYLHGALHIFDTGLCTTKIESSTFLTLKDIIEKSLDQDRFPLIVAEGKTLEKQIKIKHNNYLSFCFDSLAKMEGCLFIHGHSLDDNDKHVLREIKNNFAIKELYIGVFNPEENFEAVFEKVGSIFGTRISTDKIKIKYYDSSTASIWENFNDNTNT